MKSGAQAEYQRSGTITSVLDPVHIQNQAECSEGVSRQAGLAAFFVSCFNGMKCEYPRTTLKALEGNCLLTYVSKAKLMEVKKGGRVPT